MRLIRVLFQIVAFWMGLVDVFQEDFNLKQFIIPQHAM